MTQAAFIIGGAGTGKSTFMAQLLRELGRDAGPLEDLHSKPNVKNLVTLRGHMIGEDGLYLGYLREGNHPGTDGLDRASGPVACEWLEQEKHAGLQFIVAEGFTLASKTFLPVLAAHTNLLVVHLWADDFVRELRFMQRGTTQKDQFVKTTATAARNTMEFMADHGTPTISIDTADPRAWAAGREHVLNHLEG